MTVRAMLEAHPRSSVLDRDLLVRCIEECVDCAATCTSCADADLAEPDVAEMVRCIRLCLDCADTCQATGRILIRQTEPDLGVLRAEIVIVWLVKLSHRHAPRLRCATPRSASDPRDVP